MNKSLKIVLSFSLFILNILLFTACGCEDPTNPECKNYDPCINYISSDFEMGNVYSSAGPIGSRFPSDTVLYGGVYFKANIEDALSYQWTIGTDPRVWETQEISLVFSDDDSTFYRSNPILITLIVERSGSVCHPNENGMDTLSRYLHFRSIWEAAYWGTWEGYLDDVVDNIYQLKFLRIRDTLSYSHDEFLFNLYGEGDNCFQKYTLNSRKGYRSAYNFDQSHPVNWEECNAPYRRWNRDLDVNVNTTNNTIHMSWVEWHRDDDDNCCIEIPRKFTGHPIQ